MEKNKSENTGMDNPMNKQVEAKWKLGVMGLRARH